jgi:hypothetical protein
VNIKRLLKHILIGVSAIVLLLAPFLYLPKAFAATLASTSLVEMGSTTSSSYTNPMIAGDNQFFGIGFKPATAIASSVTIQITFPAGFTIGASGSQTASATDPVSGNACNTANGLFGTGYTALAGLSATSSGQTITITTSSALSTSNTYCAFDTYASAITNPGSASTYNVTIGTYNGGVLTDNQTIGIGVLSNTCGSSQNCNSYNVTATINPTFTMSLSGYTDAIGALASGSVTNSPGITTTVTTNAKSGWFVWMSDLNSGLTSVTASNTINTVACSTSSTTSMSGDIGSPDYALGVATVTGGTTRATGWNDSGGNTGGCLKKNVFYQIASDSAAAASDTFVTKEMVTIASTTPPGADYADTVTLIGSGSF